MPDKRHHRGPHPEDARLFHPQHLAALRAAVAELSWLLTRGYSEASALNLVGNRHQLTARQRMAVWRSSGSDPCLKHRATTLIPSAELADAPLGVDGFNLLITIESALADGLILIGRDGCHRDLASVHGTYRKVEETISAVDLIIRTLRRFRPSRVDWYLDRPVSNSGRLKTLIAERLEATGAEWNIELVASPDVILRDYEGTVVTSDSAILDACGKWTNLAATIVSESIPSAWTIDLRTDTA